MGPCWDSCVDKISKEIISYAEKSEIRPEEALQTVWKEAVQASLRCQSGGHEEIQSSSLLLIALLQLAGNKKSVFVLSASHIAEIQEATLRIVWQAPQKEVELARPPQGQELDKSQKVESPNAVRGLPPADSQHKTEKEVPSLRPEFKEARDVSEAFSAVETIWRCYFDQSEEKGHALRIRSGYSALMASTGFPLAPRIPGRVALLRGAGNAINPEVAAIFIKASIEALSEQ